MPPQVDVLTRTSPSASSGAAEHLIEPSQLRALIESSTDPKRVAQYMSEFTSRHGHLSDAISKDAGRVKWLIAIFSSSRFLSEELMRHPEWILAVDQLESTLDSKEYKSRLDAFLLASGVSVPTGLDLALFRRKELLRIVLQDRLDVAKLPDVTAQLSNLADAILDRALAAVMHELHEKYGVPVAQHGPAANTPAVFTVFALGKLGGRELNYSSDIDLMFLYSENGETSGPSVI